MTRLDDETGADRLLVVAGRLLVLGRTVAMVRAAIAADLDAGMVMRTLTWTTLRRFRAHLHQLARHLVA